MFLCLSECVGKLRRSRSEVRGLETTATYDPQVCMRGLHVLVCVLETLSAGLRLRWLGCVKAGGCASWSGWGGDAGWCAGCRPRLRTARRCGYQVERLGEQG